ncbi:MAG: hypothetical protein Q9225_006531 [Loekoesia sp. 1 TL-2023]
MIESRRLNNVAWASGNTYAFKDRDPEKTYEVFMDLIQKIIDDHYSPTNRLCGPHRKRMVPIPRMGTWQWDLSEQDSVRGQAQLTPGIWEARCPGTATAVPKSPAKIGSADPEPSFVPKVQQDDCTAVSSSKTQRDEFEWFRYIDGDFVEGGFHTL